MVGLICPLISAALLVLAGIANGQQAVGGGAKVLDVDAGTDDIAIETSGAAGDWLLTVSLSTNTGESATVVHEFVGPGTHHYRFISKIPEGLYTSATATWYVGEPLADPISPLSAATLAFLLKPPPPRDQFVIDFGVVCHPIPDLATRSDRAVAIATNFSPAQETRAGNATWYLAPAYLSAQPCWIPGASTAEWDWYDGDPSWLALLDRQLARTDIAFEQYVHVDNLLTDPDRRPNSRANDDASGLMQFRRLQLLEHVLSGHEGDVDAVNATPLGRAWLISHNTTVGRDHFGGGWYVRAQPFWDIYARHKDARWADELAWTASRIYSPSDECSADCILGHIIEAPLQYWSRLPSGIHLTETLRRAIESAKAVSEYACTDGESMSIALLEVIRTSLHDVAAPERQQLLGYLDAAQRKCAAAGKLR